ncbi:PD-(D/E)XK nuclease family protein [Isosphaeraceae bacterium EP7]
MPSLRLLKTGPFGALPRWDYLSSRNPRPDDLILVAGPTARDRCRAALASGRDSWLAGRVWCWDDLWMAQADGRPDRPALLSDAGRREALKQALDRAHKATELDRIGHGAATPGFRRQVSERISAWMQAERFPSPSPRASDVENAQRSIFHHYRAVLRELNAADLDSFASWASIPSDDHANGWLGSLGRVLVAEPLSMTPARWRGVALLLDHARTFTVTLPYVAGPALGEVYAATRPIRERLLELGLEEIVQPVDRTRSVCLSALDVLFERDDEYEIPPPLPTEGLSLIGAPRGEDLSRVVASEVRAYLEDGARPAEVAVVVRQWDDEAALIVGELHAWSIPATTSIGRPLANDACLCALKLAMGITVEDWATGPLVRFLRNGQVDPVGLGGESTDDLAVAASMIRATRVTRGLDALRVALARAANPPKRGDEDQMSQARSRKASRAAVALKIVERLAQVLPPSGWSGSWSDMVDRTRLLWRVIGLDRSEAGRRSTSMLGAAFDDQGWVIEGLGQGKGRTEWRAFVEQVGTMLGELTFPRDAEPGSVLVTTLADAAGLQSKHVLMANLGEGTFPIRAAVAGRDQPERRAGFDFDEPSEPENLAFASEALEFLRLGGMAGRTLALVYPTTDESGQDLLPASFAEDLIRRLDADPAGSRVHRSRRRYDPTLLDDPGLAISANDRRVRAVALARKTGAVDELVRLASSPTHRSILFAAASALRVTSRRKFDRSFGRFDGRLEDSRIGQALMTSFGPDHTFSASQLESFTLCPFQFFSRYVLNLEPPDERGEFDDDYADRGDRLHKALELIHVRLRDEPGDPLIRLRELVQTHLGSELIAPVGSVAAGLERIAEERKQRTLIRYAGQYADYSHEKAETLHPQHFEVKFGADAGQPVLRLGEGSDAVQLRGVIDRIDLVDRPVGPPSFRVIDYKSGAGPSKADISSALMLQLPLYALAVQKLALDGRSADLLDVGYWGLSGVGYRSFVPKGSNWDEFLGRVERFVLAQVGMLRDGGFAVSPRKGDCHQHCDFSLACRIRQARSVGKDRSGFPEIETQG